ncbi:hypothetical protein [Arenibacter certesii]|nr:hypothetical protein [Arenibacter certesii]
MFTNLIFTFLEGINHYDLEEKYIYIQFINIANTEQGVDYELCIYEEEIT